MNSKEEVNKHLSLNESNVRTALNEMRKFKGNSIMYAMLLSNVTLREFDQCKSINTFPKVKEGGT